MNWLIPDWLKGLYSIISATCRFIYDLFARLWHIIVFACAGLVAFFDQVMSVIGWLTSQFAVLVSLVGSSSNSCAAAMAAGWPPQLYGTVAWLNYYAPVSEMVIMLSALGTAWVVATVARIIKSVIPTIG